MRAVEITESGGPEVLSLCDRPIPELGAGEVLIRVAYAGVNRPDCLQRAGLYNPPSGASDLPGLEVSGHIEALGDGVTGFALGDAVCALANGGGYAEYVAVPAGQVLPAPRSLAESAALPETYFTVWFNLFTRAQIGDASSILIHGGSSGIGTTAIQLARIAGLSEIFVTAGSAEKCAFCETLGATRAINYREEDFSDIIKSEATARGVDHILDMVGAPYFGRNIKALKRGGTLTMIAQLQGAEANAHLGMIMAKMISVTGSTLRPQSAEVKARIAQALQTHVWPALKSGEIAPVMAETFPLAEASKAHRLMESGTLIGKIILKV